MLPAHQRLEAAHLAGFRVAAGLVMQAKFATIPCSLKFHGQGCSGRKLTVAGVPAAHEETSKWAMHGQGQHGVKARRSNLLWTTIAIKIQQSDKPAVRRSISQLYSQLAEISLQELDTEKDASVQQIPFTSQTVYIHA